MNKHYDQGNSYKENISLGLAYSFKASVHYHHGWKHDSAQADMVLGKDLKEDRGICLLGGSQEGTLLCWAELEHMETSKLFQEGCLSCHGQKKWRLT